MANSAQPAHTPEAPPPGGLLPEENLTRYEWAALANTFNLADGHARRAQSDAEEAIVARLAELYRASERANQIEVQREFEASFFTRAGQPSVLSRRPGCLYHYSSSLSIEVLANYLRANRLSVSLLHPTFDNIAAILRRHDIALQSVSERVFEDPEDAAHYSGTDALFLVLPNNPTGVDPERAVIEAIARECARRQLLLIVDFSFRFYSEQLATWDQYDYFDQLGLQYVGVEDTGKTWPTLDLKLGFLVAARPLHAPLQVITDDCLLNVSPFIFALVSKYVESDTDCEGVRVAEANRRVLATALADLPVEVVDTESPMTVAWIRLPIGWRSSHLCEWLSERGISVLPGGPFFWAEPAVGEQFIRVALGRPAAHFASATEALAEAMRIYKGGSGVAEDRGQTDAEDLVVRTCRDVLGRPEIALEDDFFESGGDSLTAMHVIGRLRHETGLELRVRLIFDNPTLGLLADEIARQTASNGPQKGEAVEDARSVIRAIARETQPDSGHNDRN